MELWDYAPPLAQRKPKPQIIDKMTTQQLVNSRASKLELPSLTYLHSMTQDHWIRVCALFCEELGFMVEWLDDPCIHLDLVDRETGIVVGFATCKSYADGAIKEECVQSIWDRMYGNDVKNGIVFSLAEITSGADYLADGSPIELFSGQDFIDKLAELPDASRLKLLELIYKFEFIAPICPYCGDAMDELPNAVGTYWRCYNYPRCNMTYMP